MSSCWNLTPRLSDLTSRLVGCFLCSLQPCAVVNLELNNVLVHVHTISGWAYNLAQWSTRHPRVFYRLLPCSFPLLRSSGVRNHGIRYILDVAGKIRICPPVERCRVNLDGFFETPLFSYIKYSHNLNGERYSSNISEFPTFLFHFRLIFKTLITRPQNRYPYLLVSTFFANIRCLTSNQYAFQDFASRQASSIDSLR